MRQLRAIVFILTFMASFGSEGISYSEEQYQWYDENLVIDSYQEINIFTIDARGIKFLSYDDEEGQYSEDDLETQTYVELADSVYAYFAHRLKYIRPVVDVKKIDPGKKSLVINIAVSATLKGESGGLLKEFIFGEQTYDTDMTIECVIKDSQTEKELFSYKDSQTIQLRVAVEPFQTESDQAALERVADAWARRVSLLMAKQKLKKK